MTHTHRVVSRRAAVAVAAAALTFALPWSSPTNAVATPPDDAGAAAPRYRAVDIGTLGGPITYVTAMNDQGVVVGDSDTANGQRHGFLWRDGTMTDLGEFSPTDINNSDEVVGTRDGGAYLWARGRFTALGGNMTFPKAINDRRVVVGLTVLGSGRAIPAIWAKGTVKTLPLQDVADINDRGQVAGERVFGTGDVHASLWYRNRVSNLDTGAVAASRATRINDQGWVIGYTISVQGFGQSALWRGRDRTDLTDPGGGYNQAMAVNNHGVILIRHLSAGNVLEAALWQDGVLTDLTDAGISGRDGLLDLNDRGDILAVTQSPDFVPGGRIYRPTS